jgi:hypothetical protein
VVESELNRKRNVGLAKQGIELRREDGEDWGEEEVVWWVYGLRGRVEFQLSKDVGDIV